MSDIFLSYATADLEKAKPIIELLSKQGWSVWWDRGSIPPGVEFDGFIEQAIQSAKTVVVLWSKESIGSSWVKTEADEATNQKIPLHPILIDNVRPPFAFRRIHAAKLYDWDGSPEHPEIYLLLNAIANSAGSPARPVDVEAASAVEDDHKRRRAAAEQRVKLEKEAERAEEERRREVAEQARREAVAEAKRKADDEARQKAQEVRENSELTSGTNNISADPVEELSPQSRALQSRESRYVFIIATFAGAFIGMGIGAFIGWAPRGWNESAIWVTFFGIVIGLLGGAAVGAVIGQRILRDQRWNVHALLSRERRYVFIIAAFAGAFIGMGIGAFFGWAPAGWTERAVWVAFYGMVIGLIGGLVVGVVIGRSAGKTPGLKTRH
jgi:hypothetical protein